MDAAGELNQIVTCLTQAFKGSGRACFGFVKKKVHRDGGVIVVPAPECARMLMREEWYGLLLILPGPSVFPGGAFSCLGGSV